MSYIVLVPARNIRKVSCFYSYRNCGPRWPHLWPHAGWTPRHDGSAKLFNQGL